MEITYDEVRRQVEELPIGYYAKRRIPMSMSVDEPTSYYSPSEDSITISYPIIAEGLKNAVENEDYKETAIRSMVYHELSHAILTPEDIFDWCRNEEDRYMMNVFEDERIETLLKDFYMDINFKKNVLYINGGKISTPTNPQQAFYNLVRFRSCADESLVATVESIIEKYSNLTAFKNPYYVVRNYYYDVRALYEEIVKLYNNKGAEGCSASEAKNQQIAENINNSDKSANGYDKNNQASEQKGESKENKKANGESKKAEVSIGDEGEVVEAEDDAKNGKGAKNSITLFDKALNAFRDTKTTEMLKAIISTFNKKSNSGNGCTGYSGIFNPRNIKSQNYKYFDRKIEGKGNNKFGKFHLNLFIDESGSFDNLAGAANTLIASLCEVERSNPNFNFDLICDSNGFRETPKKKRIIKADGGNYIGYDEVVSMMKKHTEKGSYNYNIVLHDGYVCSSGRKNAFLGWDRNNVTIIDTGDNKGDLRDLKNAKVVISPYDNLVDNLGVEVAKILKTAFR